MTREDRAEKHVNDSV